MIQPTTIAKKLKFKSNVQMYKRVLSIFAFLFLYIEASAQFTAGNVVVLQVSDGSSAPINTGNSIILREYTPLGVSGLSVAISTSVNPLIVSGAATSEGQLTLSQNGRFLCFGGYAQSLPNSTPLAASSGTAINRGVGIVDVSGSYTRIAVSNTFHTGNNIRSAASDGNNNYWSAGGNEGTNYFGTVSATTNVQNVTANTRHVAVFNSNLFFATGSGTTGIYQVGSGLPTTSGQTNSLIINTVGTGIGSASTYGFFFNSASTICYIADDRTLTNGGGIQKWTYGSGVWTLAYTLSTGAAFGARSVVADFSGTNPQVYATTSESTANRLIAINDVGALSTATTLATSVTNSIFRGIAFSPFCNAPQVNSISNNGPICSNQTLSLTAITSSVGPFTYTWTGPGSFTSALQSPTLTGATGGNYSLTISNGCGTASLAATVSVNALPALSVNSATICAGGTVALIANGAATYTWSNAISSSSISVSPTISTNYTVNATSLAGCANSATTSVFITTAPVISVNSATTCLGAAKTLTATGASSYTWSTLAQTATVNLNPTSTTVYTVIGIASGCNALITATASIVVNPLPTLTISASSPSICAGKTATIIASGASTYTWSNSATSPSVVVSPSLSTNYTTTGTSALGCTNNATVLILVGIVPQIFVNSASICLGNSAALFASGPAATSYSWSNSSTTPSISVNPIVNTSYTVTGVSGAGCSNSAVANVVVNPIPTVSLAAINSVLCLGDAPVSLNGTPSGGVYSGTGVSGNLFSSVVAGVGTFTLVYSFTNSLTTCSNSNSKVVSVSACTGITELTNNLGVVRYPNPTREKLNINIPNAVAACEIEVYNVNAQRVYVQTTTEKTCTVDVSDYTKGLYFLKIRCGREVSFIKFVRE